ncbi:rRNA small subunit methyltransferase B [Actinomyces sp. 594]|nr:rRNA small subunit methyltransferase B [Actinomyces sp. 594]NDR52692.1 rRNA small subunit methyltransferase B [Actinomyces sp. 565]
MRDDMTRPDRRSVSAADRPRTRRGTTPVPTGPAVDPVRLACLHALTKVREDDAYANLVLPEILDQARLEGRDAGFATALTYGTLRLQGRYDAIIGMCIDRPLGRVDAVVLDALRLGTHQLLGMRVPTHAAVSTTVDLAAYSAGRGAAGFVNAVMRRISEEDLDGWLARLRADAPDALTALSRTHSHPVWVVKAMRQALKVNGRPNQGDELEALLDADNTDPQVTLCARPGLIGVDELAAQVHAATGEEPRPGRLSPYALVLSGGDPGRIEAVRDSRAGVEDEASQLVALMLAEAPLEGSDARWLDLCAGPGGKAALLGALAAGRGARLVANEVAAHRARLVDAAVRALPEGVVEVRADDGRNIGRQEPGAYDRVLVDAPCSGLGSLRRRPEARWRRTPQDVAALAELQRELLASAAAAVRPGGVIAYVTCTPHVLETNLVVRDVTRQVARSGITLEPLHAGRLAAAVSPQAPAAADREALQTWPHLDGADAMFCALLRRTV